jgi:GT2 family glycosyltransferase
LKIGIVVVAFGLADDLWQLFCRSFLYPKTECYLFLHSQIPEVRAVCERMAAYQGVHYYDYGENRGLARSWNDGLYDGYNQGMDVMLIANDDALPQHDDATRIGRVAVRNRDLYMVSGRGVDLREMKSGDMLFALAAVNPIALGKIGYFDENLFPIYYEDCDYYRRAQLAGLERHCLSTTYIQHAGSKSLDLIAAPVHEDRYRRNQAYYFRKWGGEKGHEVFATPFNQSALGLKIEADQRHHPYPGYDRIDSMVVK